MERCPACRARLGAARCPRCGCDLALPLRAEAAAQALTVAAVQALAAGRRAEAATLARRAVGLKEGGVAAAVAACAGKAGNP